MLGSLGEKNIEKVLKIMKKDMSEKIRQSMKMSLPEKGEKNEFC